MMMLVRVSDFDEAHLQVMAPKGKPLVGSDKRSIITLCRALHGGQQADVG